MLIIFTRFAEKYKSINDYFVSNNNLNQMQKPILIEQYADNGEFSHWHLIDTQTGCVMWSSFPEETTAQGQSIISFNDVLRIRDSLLLEISN